MARFFREEFDRGREFYVLRPFKYAGEEFAPGPYPINKTLFSVRRLRQLFDMRNLEMCAPGTNPNPFKDYDFSKFPEEIDTTPKPELRGVVVDADAEFPAPRRSIPRRRSGSLPRRRSAQLVA